jgi:ParB-like chromosome segregation protein Spo0J
MSFDNPWGLKVKKELVELWPPLPPEEFEELKKSLAERGFLEPIVVNENNEVIEGHQRLLAWISLGKKEPPAIRRVNTGGDLAKEIALSVEYNARRRHLVKSELALIVAEAFKKIEELTQKKLFVANNINTSNPESSLEKETITKVAEKVGISQPTLTKALKVVEKGTPEVQRAVEKGELSVERAYKIVQHPPEEQKKLLEEPQPQPKPQTQLRKIDKARWREVYSAFQRNQSVEIVEKLAGELGVTVDEVLRVINLVKIERGELPISLSTLARTAKPTSQPMLKPLEGGAPTPTTTTHTTATTSTIRRKEKEEGGEEDTIVLSDPYVVSGVRAYAREQRMTLEQAASQIIVEHLTQIGIKW